MRKKAVMIIIAASVIGIAGLIYYRMNNDDKGASIVTSGIVEGTEVNISSKAPGRVLEICCNEGDSILKGAIVIKLESDELAASVKQAEAGVARAEAEIRVAEAAIEGSRADIQGVEADIRDAEADVERTKVDMEEAEREMKRAKSLFDEGLVTQEAYEKALAGYKSSSALHESSKAKHSSAVSKRKSAAARLNTTLSQLTAAQKGLKEAEANLLYQQSRFNDTVIMTPISGTVVFKAFEAGETVNPGVTVLTIVDMDNLYVRTDIDESRIGGVVLNKEADIMLENSPDKAVSGKVMEISRHAEFATQRDVVRGRQDIRTFRVKIAVDDHSGILKPGMTVTVTIPK
ncbi:MAG: efflux RND transporter periplasmic adaptor subunit [Nitrospirae bacterium]|nr:efflux RND transporter periplasmic adaptor subunit [Nitrospirota bacterium]